MSLIPSSVRPPQVHKPSPRIVNSPQGLPQLIYGATGAAASALAVAAYRFRTSGGAGGVGIPPAAHSGYETNSSRNELAQAHQRHAHPMPSLTQAHPSTAGSARPHQELQQASAGPLVTVPTAAATNSSSDSPAVADHVHSSPQAQHEPQQITPIRVSPVDEGYTVAVAAPPPLSVLPPWVRLDFTAFTGGSFSVDTAPIAGGNAGGTQWGIIAVEDRIATPRPTQGERIRDGASLSYLRRQKQMLREHHSVPPQANMAADGVLTTADASSLASPPLFEWVPYDGWDISDLCQGQGGGYCRRDALGQQHRVTHRLRHGDLSEPLGTMEPGTTIPGETQSPGGAGSAVIRVRVNANLTTASPQRTAGISGDDLNAPQRGLQQQQQHRDQQKVAAPAAADTPRGCRVARLAENMGRGKCGGGSDTGGRRHEDFATTFAVSPPPPPLLSTAIARGASPLSRLQRQHTMATAPPPSVVFSDAVAAAAAARRTSTGVSGPLFRPIEAMMRKALPISRAGFSFRACSVYTGVRSDGTLSIIMLEEYPGYPESTPTQSSQAKTSSLAFLATATEGAPTVASVQEVHHATSSFGPQVRQDSTWPPPTASTEHPVLSSSVETDISLQLPATVPQSAAAGVAGAKFPTDLLQDPTVTGGVVNEGAAVSNPFVGLTSGSPCVPPISKLPPLPDGGGPPYATLGDRARPTRLGAVVATANPAAEAHGLCRPVELEGDDSPTRAVMVAGSMTALRGKSVSSVSSGGEGDGQGRWFPLGLCALSVAADAGNGALASVSPFGTLAAADAATRAEGAASTRRPVFAEQTHLAVCDRGSRRGAVPAVANTAWMTHMTGAATAGPKPLSAPVRVMPSLTPFNPTESPSAGTTSTSLSAPRSAKSDGGGSDRQRNRQPTKPLLPAWCHVVAEVLLAPPLSPPPKLCRPGQRQPTFSGTTTTTVMSDIDSRMWSAEARGGAPIGWSAKFVTAAERASATQRTALSVSAVANHRGMGGVEQQEEVATPLLPSSLSPPCQSADPGVDAFGNMDPTEPQHPPPVPLKATMPAPLPLVSNSNELDGVGGGRGVVRVITKGSTVDFDAYDAPHTYTQALLEVNTTGTNTTAKTNAMGSGHIEAAATADSAATAATRERACTSNVHLSTSATLCRFRDYHQHRRAGARGAVANSEVDARGAGVSAPIAAVATTVAESTKNNPDDDWAPNCIRACVGDSSALPTRFHAAGAAREKWGSRTSTIARSIETAGLLPHSEAAWRHARICGLPISTSSPAVVRPTMLAPDGTELVVQEHANEHPPQRRHSQVGYNTGATAAAFGYSAHKNDAYIMSECANAGSLRVGDAASASPNAAMATSSGMLGRPASVMRLTVTMRSSNVPAGADGEARGGDVVHPLGFVNTSQSQRFKDVDRLGSPPIHAENIPLFPTLPASIEAVPISASPLASPLPNRLQKQPSRGSSNVVKSRAVSRVPTKPLAQHPSKLRRPRGHTAGCDV
ncbi:hypothetical protein, conserved [Leishmania shawi]|uniref:Uncharacterized protein n=1 Tax=Leishmania shawi TaxID=5680 RepID=A0ABR3EGP0_9TRYP